MWHRRSLLAPLELRIYLHFFNNYSFTLWLAGRIHYPAHLVLMLLDAEIRSDIGAAV
jgi:hypothetical protein